MKDGARGCGDLVKNPLASCRKVGYTKLFGRSGFCNIIVGIIRIPGFSLF
jgi:hypothetical protein